MKEYMTNLGSVLMLTALSDMLVPEGGLKKYVSIAMGFILITAALSVIPGDFDGLFFNDASFKLSDGEIARAESKLSNEQFVSKAPQTLVDAEREKMKKYQGMKEKCLAQLENL